MNVCLYNTAPREYLLRPLDGRDTLTRVAAWTDELARLQPADDPVRVTVYSPAPLPAVPRAWSLRSGDPLTQAGIARLLAEQTGDADTEIVFAFLDQPFLNLDLTRRMLARHRDYRAEYTFADGYPAGLAPEPVSGRVVSHLCSLASDTTLLDRSGLFPIVQNDINRLDVETELSAVDQRLLRLTLAVDTAANVLACERLAPGAPADIDEWAAHAEARRVSHRTLPRFVSIQVIEQEVQRVAYSPYPSMRDDVLAPGLVMDVGLFDDLIGRIAAFSPEAVIHLSLWGEIALHPRAVDLVRAVLRRPRLHALVETSGVGWQEPAVNELFELADDRLTVIVGLDSNDPAVYEAVRGDGFAEARAFAGRAVEIMPESAYVQAVRCDLTEPALDAFYRDWHALTGHIIIEKYDHFCGRLPPRKIGDISPLDRFPCWHLQRDCFILANGDVPLCREDLDAAHRLGNVFTDDLAQIWKAGEPRFSAHVSGAYSDICELCDEYYTFNF